MARRHRAKSKTPGLPPGSLVYTGQKRVEVPDLSILQYSPTSIKSSKSLTDIEYPVTEGVLWIDIRGLHETELLRQLGGQFGVHALALEDIVDIYQRPKFDNYDEGFLVLLESFSFTPDEMHLAQEQISVFCGKDFVLSFQEDAKDCFVTVRERIKGSQGRIRKYHADYLAYSLIDNIVDQYFVTLESIGDVLDGLEEEIAKKPDFETKNRIHRMKRVVLDMRKGITPLREAVSMLLHSDSHFITEKTRPYLQDLYGNVLQAIEMTETYRDILSGVQDLYLAELSYKINKVIQTLTIVSAIFIPLTFVVGVYGMNFDYMPELRWKYGYFYVLGFMAIVTAVMLFWFKRRKWL